MIEDDPFELFVQIPLQLDPVKVTESDSTPFTSIRPSPSVLIYVPLPILIVTPFPTTSSPLTSIYLSDPVKLKVTPSPIVNLVPDEITRDLSKVKGLHSEVSTISPDSRT